jgi:hypothetical protein
MAHRKQSLAATHERTPLTRAMLGIVLPMFLLTPLILAGSAAGQTTSRRTADGTSRTNPYQSARAKQKATSMASYVSGYAGDDANQDNAQAPAANQETEPEMVGQAPDQEEPQPAPRARNGSSRAKSNYPPADPGYRTRRSPEPIPDEEVVTRAPTHPHGGCADGSCNGGGHSRGVTYFSEGSGGGCADGSCDDGCDEYGWGGGDSWGGGRWAPLFPGLHERLYFEVDYLMWWTRGDWVPELVTTGVPPAAAAGPARTVLFGGSALNDDMRSGMKFTLGSWLDPCQEAGFEATYLFLGNADESATFDSQAGGPTVLVRPYQNVANAYALTPWVVANTAANINGKVTVDDTNEFYTLEANFRRRMLWSCSARMDATVGYRFASLSDDLSINTNSTGPTAADSTIITDQFRASNYFNGVQLGVATEVRRNFWSMKLASKLAMGSTHSTVNIAGNSIWNGVAANYGMLAVGSNIGEYTRDTFSVMPELDLTLGYDFTPSIRGTVGYNFLYWSRIVRAGRYVDPQLNPNETGPPPVNLPAAANKFSFDSSDFWAQGINVGLECRY